MDAVENKSYLDHVMETSNIVANQPVKHCFECLNFIVMWKFINCMV